MTLTPEQLGQSKADLAGKLRELRRRAGLTGDRLAKRCALSQSQISKFETGRRVPTLVDLERILKALDTPPEVVAEVTALARVARTEWQDKRSSWRRGIEKRQAELAALEAQAVELRYFLPSMVTGLLAAPAYVRASLAHTPGDVGRTAARKLERQSVLHQPGKRFTFLLTEQAVKWSILPPAGMAAQIGLLASRSRLPSIRLGVIPSGVMLPRGPMNTFTVYDRRLVTVETFTGRMVMQDPRDVSEHLSLFSSFEEGALFDDAALTQLAVWAEEFRKDL